MRKALLHCLCLALLFCAGEPVYAACAGLPPSPHCGSAPSALFSDAGDLLVAFADAGHVYLSRSRDQGASYEAAVRVNPEPEDIYADGENRPVLALGGEGVVLVAWTRNTGGAWTGDIRFARSLDGGASFEPVRTINDDGLLASHRFVALRATAAGMVYLAWLDKRDQMAAAAMGHDYTGAALYYTVSADQGASFRVNRKVADHSCECCRVALATAGPGAVQVLWRHVFEDGQVRDHATATLTTDGATAPLRASRDDWRIDGCPHHGPALAAGDGGYHMSWFSNGNRQRGVLYGWFDPVTAQTSRIRSIDARPSAGHPALAVRGERVALAWKSFDGERMQVRLQQSDDGGRNWQPPVTVSSSAGTSDHPQLLVHGQDLFLAWHSTDEGLRLLPLPASATGETE